MKREIWLAQQNDLVVAAYYTKLKGLWDELASYSTIPLCKCGARKKVIAELEKENVYQFLMGLNDQYGIIRSQILNMEPFPSINKVYDFVSKEENQQSITSIGQSQLTEAATFSVKPLSSQTRESNEEQPRGKFRCAYCNKPGHT